MKATLRTTLPTNTDNIYLQICYYEHKGQLYFDEHSAIESLSNGVLKFSFFDYKNNRWQKETDDKVSISVDSSDLFAWGYSNSDWIQRKDLEQLLNDFADYGEKWCASVFCMRRYKRQPQCPIKFMMIMDGTWKDWMNDLEKPSEYWDLEDCISYGAKDKTLSDLPITQEEWDKTTLSETNNTEHSE